MIKKEIALINNEPIESEYLFNKACNLTDISQELQVITDLLEQFDYMYAKKDTFGVEYFLSQRKISNATDVLQNLVKEISEISTDICPDKN